MTGIVMAILFSVLPNHQLELVNATPMTLSECMASAKEINFKPDLPFVLLCGPKEGADIES